MAKKTILLFFGPPGSGKGTQADLLGEKINLPVISPGELFRHERDTHTALGKKIENIIASGSLVSDDLVTKVLDKRFKQGGLEKGFIYDGYPRKDTQLELFKKRVKKITTEDDKILAVYIDVSDKEVKHRLGGRRVCDCGAAYHLKYNPPKKTQGKCDLCGKKLYTREDDKPAIIKDRLISYHKRTQPLIKYFEDNDMLIRVDGEQAIEKVKDLIYKKLKKFNVVK